jgi:hypothetical protein
MEVLEMTKWAYCIKCGMELGHPAGREDFCLDCALLETYGDTRMRFVTVHKPKDDGSIALSYDCNEKRIFKEGDPGHEYLSVVWFYLGPHFSSVACSIAEVDWPVALGDTA